ncbi:MAG TPA: MYXO-CTERM sorting domain-containing protein, partial [Enhygromyxa sp.]|nr:MYXO-CTERM sorting domain-containing protein [Enhygromyxa sp.]
SPSAAADPFAAGSLIIPMDTDYQDMGMLRAFGLVYELLLNDVPVRWAIRSDKLHGETDFSASATDLLSGEAIPLHDYRGGPWIIDAADAADALPIIEAWQQANPNVAVHEATADFDAEVGHYLVVAPTIAMIADGNQKIARKYMEAAGIPDSTGDLAWPDASPDMLDPLELAGPTVDNHRDGALFDADGDPVYCQLMSMHWGVKDAEDNPEVVAEVREYLNNPVHFFAECQAVNAFENLDPHGFFLTPNGFEIGASPNAVDHYNAASPYHQMDGLFEAVGGSEPSYSLPAGDQYLAGGITMITGAGSPEGVQDVWMTGYLDGTCPPTEAECGSLGKISYLGGHEYKTDLPISANPDTQGTRLFLNSLFEAPCATVDGLPALNLATAAPAYTAVPTVEVDVAFVNTSAATALDATLRAPLPPNTSFMSATDEGQLIDGEVVWQLGNLGPDEAGERSFVIELADHGLYDNSAALDYRVGLNHFTLPSNVAQTLYDDEPPGDGDGDSGDGDSGDGDPGDGDSGDGDSTGESASGTGDDGNEQSDSADDGETGESGNDQGIDDSGGGGCSCTTDSRGSTPLGWLLLSGLGVVFVRRRRRA